VTEEPLGYLLWWKSFNWSVRGRYYIYCRMCSIPNMRHWESHARNDGSEVKFWPVYRDHLGDFSQKCNGFHLNGDKFLFRGKFDTELFTQAELVSLPSEKELNAQR
jgi:hypothetical protein